MTGWFGPNCSWSSAWIYAKIAYLPSSDVYSSTALLSLSMMRFNALITLFAWTTLLSNAFMSAALASLMSCSYSLRMANYFSYVSIVSLRIINSSARV